MAKTSCIRHPAYNPFATIRRDFVEVTGGDHCLAVTLQYFESWTNTKLAQREQAKTANAIASRAGEEAREDESLWVYATAETISDAMSGLFGRNRVGAALRRAVDEGLLERRNNPRYAWDRTLQYRLNVAGLQARIDALEDGAMPDPGHSNARNSAINSTAGGDQSPPAVQAIPSSPSKTSILEAAALRSAAETREDQPQGQEQSQGQEHVAGARDALDSLRSGTAGGEKGKGRAKSKFKSAPPLGAAPPAGGGFGSRPQSTRTGARPDPVNWMDAVPDHLRPAAEVAGKDGWGLAMTKRPARARDWAALPPDQIAAVLSTLKRDHAGKRPDWAVADALDALAMGGGTPRLMDNQRPGKERIVRDVDWLHPERWEAVYRIAADGTRELLRHEPPEDQK